MIGIIYSDKYLLHAPPFYHSENPERLSAIINSINTNSDLKRRIQFLEPRSASQEEIRLVHTEKHFNYVKNSIQAGKHVLDSGDTYANKHSLDVALLAAGGVLTAVDVVMNEKFLRIFCAVRPPGHHAESNRVMGFCFFNNIAIGAQHAIEKHKLERVAIVDWDVHHGNGTQEIFYNSSEVLFISLHQHPLYPGTGMSSEIGIGEGKGFTMNFPLPPRTGGKIYLSIFNEKILQRLIDFNPQLLMISAGFDAHRDDPLSDMKLVENDYFQMTKLLNRLADEIGIPIVSVLEGGYNLTALGNSVCKHLEGFIHEPNQMTESSLCES
ncbi:MAG: histone deacetylase [Bacteroidetes bacterium]|nr:histone deacetylase [Bacteroidota bacterium]MBU2584773.1 histone deacetylase [Bacteroidota bacterium]